MGAWVRVFWAAAVLIIPGGFALLIAYLLAKTVHQRYHRLEQDRAKVGGRIRFAELFTGIHFKDLLQEARAAFRQPMHA